MDRAVIGNTKQAPTERQVRILAFMYDFMGRFLRPPTIREIGDKVGISSTSVVNYHLNKLQYLGLVKRVDLVTRGTAPADAMVMRYGVQATIRTKDGELVTGELVKEAA